MMAAMGWDLDFDDGEKAGEMGAMSGKTRS